MAQRTDGPVKCGWTQNGQEKSPHSNQARFRPPPIMDSILDNIGNTPLVRINKIAKEEGLECELHRIGKRMIEEAERTGRIKPGDTLIEPTSGNTGIGLALAAALKGYRMIITLPEKMSQEKVDVLKGLGAEIIRTPTEAAWDAPESHIGVAKRLNAEIPNSHILDQYTNTANPLAHYDQTAEEILEQCGGKLDAVVISAGTGGTLTGIARKLKEKVPGIVVVGVDPYGSILALPEEANKTDITTYAVEGIGYDFVPAVCQRDIADVWYKSSDRPSFIMSRRLIRSEGLLCGGSSGSAMDAAINYIKDHKVGAGKRVVVVLPDGVRNYMTKFLNDDWMVDMGFIDFAPTTYGYIDDWKNATVGNLKIPKAVTVKRDESLARCVDLFKRKGFDQLPVVSETGRPVGLVTAGQVFARLASGKVNPDTSVAEVMFRFEDETGKKEKYVPVTKETRLEDLQRFFETHSSAFVTDPSGKILHVVTKIDIVNYLTSRK